MLSRHPSSIIRNLFVAVTLAAFLSSCDEPSELDNGQRQQILQTTQAMQQSGQADQAANVLKEAQVKYPKDPEILKRLGYALILSGKPMDAVPEFDQLIALTPNDPLAYNGKAVALDHAGNHITAQELYQQALKLSPQTVSIQNNYAMSLILNDEPAKAVPLLETLRQHTPDNATIRQNLAMAYAMSGQHAKAFALASQDMTPAEAKDNIHFYEEYAKRKMHKTGAIPESEVLRHNTSSALKQGDNFLGLTTSHDN